MVLLQSLNILSSDNITGGAYSKGSLCERSHNRIIRIIAEYKQENRSNKFMQEINFLRDVNQESIK